MRFWTYCLAWGLLLGSANVAAADSSVIVLGLKSVEGDDGVTFGLSGALRQSAGGIRGWDVRDQAVTLSQMSLAHGCEDVDAHCLADIAKALDVNLIIYGTVRRSSARDDYQYVARLNLFDASTGAIERDATVTFAQSLQDAAMLRPVATELVKELAPGTASQALTIQTNVPGAEVYVDGELMGQVSDDEFTMHDLEPGGHSVQVTAVGYLPFEGEIELKEGKPQTVRAELESSVEEGGEGEPAESDVYGDYASADGGVPVWLTGTMFGIGVAGLAGMVASWAVINGVAKDDTYATYSAGLYNGGMPLATDVCAAASGSPPIAVPGVDAGQIGEVADMCSTADTFELLQWVFLGVGAAGIITGVTLVIIDGSAGSDTAAASNPAVLAVTPDVGRERAGFSATLRF